LANFAWAGAERFEGPCCRSQVRWDSGSSDLISASVVCRLAVETPLTSAEVQVAHRAVFFFFFFFSELTPGPVARLMIEFFERGLPSSSKRPLRYCSVFMLEKKFRRAVGGECIRGMLLDIPPCFQVSKYLLAASVGSATRRLIPESCCFSDASIIRSDFQGGAPPWQTRVSSDSAPNPKALSQDLILFPGAVSDPTTYAKTRLRGLITRLSEFRSSR